MLAHLKKSLKKTSEPWVHCASGNVFSGGEGREEKIIHQECFFPHLCDPLNVLRQLVQPGAPTIYCDLTRSPEALQVWVFKYQFATGFQPGKTVGTKLLQVLPVWPKWGKPRPWCWRRPERTWRGRPPAWSSSQQPSTMRSGFSPWDLVFTQLPSPESLVSLFLLLHLVFFLSDVSLSSPQMIYCRCDLSGTKTRSFLSLCCAFSS